MVANDLRPHAGLEAPHGMHFTAPVTFGQIAYTVLNQTLVCLAIERQEEPLEEPYSDA